VVVGERIVGVRRLPARGLRHRRQYELRFTDGGSASCSLPRLELLLEAHERPEDFGAVVRAADAARRAGDGAGLVEWPSGRRLAGVAGGSGPRESIRRRGGWIESSHGWKVRPAGRSGLDYVDDRGPLHLDSEWMATPTLVIHHASIPPDRPEVRERVVRLWLWAGYDVDLDVPEPG